MKKTILGLVVAAMALPAAAQTPQTERGTITFYDQVNYNGREWETDDATSRFHWDYRIRSVAIHPGDRWQICARPRFQECIVLDRSVNDATLIGVTNQIGSVRPAPEAPTAPASN
jgi:hypothetical protein